MNVVRIFLFIALALSVACNSKPQLSTQEGYETIQCKDKCIIVFKPDSAVLAKKHQNDKEFDFAQSLAEQERYTRQLENILQGSDIRMVETTSRFILVNTGSKNRRFDARDPEDGYPLGVILSRPDGEPMIHFGLFTDLEYKEMVESYFR